MKHRQLDGLIKEHNLRPDTSAIVGQVRRAGDIHIRITQMDPNGYNQFNIDWSTAAEPDAKA